MTDYRKKLVVERYRTLIAEGHLPKVAMQMVRNAFVRVKANGRRKRMSERTVYRYLGEVKA